MAQAVGKADGRSEIGTQAEVATLKHVSVQLENSYILATDDATRTLSIFTDGLRCYGLVQLCNGSMAALVCAGCWLSAILRPAGLDGAQKWAVMVPWSLLRFLVLAFIGGLTLQALKSPGHTRLLQAAVVVQLLWFCHELVLGSAAMAIAPNFVGVESIIMLPMASVAKVYGCGALIAIAALLTFYAKLLERQADDESDGGEDECGRGFDKSTGAGGKNAKVDDGNSAGDTDSQTAGVLAGGEAGAGSTAGLAGSWQALGAAIWAVVAGGSGEEEEAVEAQQLRQPLLHGDNAANV